MNPIVAVLSSELHAEILRQIRLFVLADRQGEALRLLARLEALNRLAKEISSDEGT